MKQMCSEIIIMLDKTLIKQLTFPEFTLTWHDNLSLLKKINLLLIIIFLFSNVISQWNLSIEKYEGKHNLTEQPFKLDCYSIFHIIF